MKVDKAGFFFGLGLAIAIVVLAAGCQQAAGPGSESETSTQSAAPPAESQEMQSQAPASASPQPRTVTLAEGTPLKARTTGTLSTDSHQVGDSFTATLEEPLVEGNWVIAPKGATVEGRIVEADKGGRVKGVARLAIQLARLQTTDGQAVEITTSTVAVEAESTKGEDATKIAIGTGIGAAIGAIAGGKKGAGIGAATGAGAGTGIVLATRGDEGRYRQRDCAGFRASLSGHDNRKQIGSLAAGWRNHSLSTTGRRPV